MNKYNILHLLVGILMFALVMFSHCYYTITLSFFILLVFYFLQEGNINTILMKKELCADKNFTVADMLGLFIPKYQPTQLNRTLVSYTVLIVLLGMLLLKWNNLKNERSRRIASGGAYPEERHAEGDIAGGGKWKKSFGAKRCRKVNSFFGGKVSSRPKYSKCKYVSSSKKSMCRFDEDEKARICYNNGYRCDSGHIPRNKCRRRKKRHRRGRSSRGRSSRRGRRGRRR